jgi:predicted O-methyltransferase YrrM
MWAKVQVLDLLSNATVGDRVETEWRSLSEQYQAAYLAMSPKYMARPELSFHPFVKLLGYLCVALYSVPGDVLEIGVWKGKSLALMERLSPPSAMIIGIDPCEIEGQPEELSHFHRLLFPRSKIIKEYSERAVEQTLRESTAFKLLHIDGAHASYNVWDDFLLYERFVLPGGFIVFDDYVDPEFSPEVGPAIDRMNELGLFNSYHVVGSLPGYASSFVLKKKKNTLGVPPIGTALRWLHQRARGKMTVLPLLM